MLCQQSVLKINEMASLSTGMSIRPTIEGQFDDADQEYGFPSMFFNDADLVGDEKISPKPRLAVASDAHKYENKPVSVKKTP